MKRKQDTDKKLPDHWLTITKRINSIAQTGLAFSKDEHDRERYTELLALSIRILQNITEIDSKKLEFVFNREGGYQTPKVGIRAVVIKDQKVLLVKEKMDHKWSLPGGWADTGLSPGEITVKEVKEESGYDVKPKRILGLIYYNRYQEEPFPFDVYNLFMECEIDGGEPVSGAETSEVRFFDIDNLPDLSVRRVTKDQIIKMYELSMNKMLEPIFD